MWNRSDRTKQQKAFWNSLQLSQSLKNRKYIHYTKEKEKHILHASTQTHINTQLACHYLNSLYTENKMEMSKNIKLPTILSLRETGGKVLRHRHQVDRGWRCVIWPLQRKARITAGILECLEGHLVQQQAQSKPVRYTGGLQSWEGQTTNTENLPENWG